MGTRRQAAQRGADENQRHYHGGPPDRQHTARPPRASRRQPFGQAGRTAALRWLGDDAWRVMAYLIRISGGIAVHRGLLMLGPDGPAPACAGRLPDRADV